MFQYYPENFQNNNFLLSDKLEDNYTVLIFCQSSVFLVEFWVLNNYLFELVVVVVSIYSLFVCLFVVAVVVCWGVQYRPHVYNPSPSR